MNKTVEELLKDKKKAEVKICEILSEFYKKNKEIQMIYADIDTTEVHENGELMDLIFDVSLEIAL